MPRKFRADVGNVKVEDSKPAYGGNLREAPTDFVTFYKQARTREAAGKAVLFGLKNAVLVGDLLDRRLFVREAHFVLSTVKDRILGSSSLTNKTKHALLNRLANCVEFRVDKTPPQPADPPIPATKPLEWR